MVASFKDVCTFECCTIRLTQIMTVIFNYKKIMKEPKGQIYRFIKSTLRSVIFLTCYCTSAWTFTCLFRNLRGKEANWMYYANGLGAGAMVLMEAPGRRLELALYCMPRAFESLWNSFVNKGYVSNIPRGEAIYFSLATGVLMSLYQQDPGCIYF
jgi:hypothetical protein